MTGLTEGVEQSVRWLAGGLLTASVQGALLVAAVWLVCRRVRSIPASIRAMLWWLASLKLILALVGLPSIPLPVLPADVDGLVVIGGAGRMASVDSPLAARTPKAEPSPASGEAPPVSVSSPWMLEAIALWLIGVSAHAVRLLGAVRKVRGVLARSAPVGDEDAALVRRLASDVGLKRQPDVRVSDEVDTPQVVGIRRPIVLLPSTVAASFAPDERAMALCHELVHVRRCDLLLGWVPACAERLFFFHPLARLAAREYVLAREAACDAAVLCALGVAPQEYGRVLLRLGITGADPGLSAAASSRSASSLRRRLDMLHHIAQPRRPAAWLIAGVAALALLPWQLVARTPEVPPAGSAGPVAARAQSAAEPQSPAVVADTKQPPKGPGTVPRDAELLAGTVPRDAELLAEARMRRELESQLAQASAREQAVVPDAQQQNLDAISAQLRELERALRQKGVTDLSRAQEIQKAEEQLRRVRVEILANRLEEVARLQQEATRQINRQAPLEEHAAQLRRMQESIAQQMQRLVEQQKALEELQRMLASETERIREAIERAVQEAGKSAPK